MTTITENYLFPFLRLTSSFAGSFILSLGLPKRRDGDRNFTPTKSRVNLNMSFSIKASPRSLTPVVGKWFKSERHSSSHAYTPRHGLCYCWDEIQSATHGEEALNRFDILTPFQRVRVRVSMCHQKKVPSIPFSEAAADDDDCLRVLHAWMKCRSLTTLGEIIITLPERCWLKAFVPIKFTFPYPWRSTRLPCSSLFMMFQSHTFAVERVLPCYFHATRSSP